MWVGMMGGEIGARGGLLLCEEGKKERRCWVKGGEMMSGM